jgi:crossover junction endodeoxyribonuclease RuvC
MLKLGRAQGVAIAGAMSRQIIVSEYSPKKIKQSITGNGNATKEQVAGMLEHILKFKHDSKFMDATDGLAAAYCHFMQKNIGIETAKSKIKIPPKKKATSWDTFVSNNPTKIKK